jgi:hypothetical protein
VHPPEARLDRPIRKQQYWHLAEEGKQRGQMQRDQDMLVHPSEAPELSNKALIPGRQGHESCPSAWSPAVGLSLDEPGEHVPCATTSGMSLVVCPFLPPLGHCPGLNRYFLAGAFPNPAAFPNSHRSSFIFCCLGEEQGILRQLQLDLFNTSHMRLQSICRSLTPVVTLAQV